MKFTALATLALLSVLTLTQSVAATPYDAPGGALQALADTGPAGCAGVSDARLATACRDAVRGLKTALADATPGDVVLDPLDGTVGGGSALVHCGSITLGAMTWTGCCATVFRRVYCVGWWSIDLDDLVL